MSIPFEGMTVLVTGTVGGMSRGSVQNAVADLGGRWVGSVSKSTDLVVLGDGAGVSKTAKVEAFDTRVMSADDFLSLVADPSTPQATGMPYSQFMALTATAEDNSDREPGPGDPDYVAMLDRHLLSKAVVHPYVAGEYVKQIRIACSCGHRWLAQTSAVREACPVETGEVATPTTSSPWSPVPGESGPGVRWLKRSKRAA